MASRPVAHGQNTQRKGWRVFICRPGRSNMEFALGPCPSSLLWIGLVSTFHATEITPPVDNDGRIASSSHHSEWMALWSALTTSQDCNECKKICTNNERNFVVRHYSNVSIIFKYHPRRRKSKVIYDHDKQEFRVIFMLLLEEGEIRINEKWQSMVLSPILCRSKHNERYLLEPSMLQNCYKLLIVYSRVR